MATFVKKSVLPETVIGAEGTSKRNIIRKNSGGPGSSGGGGGGKARKETSGKTIDDGSTYEDPSALDEHDPNYDSEDDGGESMPRSAGLRRADIGKSKMTLSAYKKLVDPIIKEFFVSGAFDDLASSLSDIEAPEYLYEFVKRTINKSMDQGDRERELVSQMLSSLYPDLLSSSVIGKGFERLFEMVDEIEKDAPAARAQLSSYLARAVVDEVLPPSFLVDSVVCNLGGDIVEHAKLLLSRDHGGAKVEKIWGPGDGRPVEEIKVAVDQLLEEYLLSLDMAEAVRCIVEIRAPMFFHEIVKRAVNIALDKGAEKQVEMSKLLAELCRRDLLTEKQAVKGFNRLFALIPDISLDNPAAGRIVQEFCERAKTDNVLPADFLPDIQNAQGYKNGTGDGQESSNNVASLESK